MFTTSGDKYYGVYHLVIEWEMPKRSLYVAVKDIWQLEEDMSLAWEQTTPVCIVIDTVVWMDLKNVYVLKNIIKFLYF